MLTKNQNKIFILSVILWVFITVFRLINRIPDFDEAHAWTIAQQLNLFEIFKLMHIEGHTFIWYLLLMPFAKADFLYPYSIQFLNWFICLLALIFFWKKAPFNFWIKIFLTFSYPFLFLYSVPARCYSLSILFLFLLAYYFKDRINNPLLYSVLLVLSANTSAMALIPATVLGLIFIFDIFKSKIDKNLIIGSFCILMCGVVLIFIQNFTFDASVSNPRIGFNITLLKNVLLFKNLWLNGFILGILACFMIRFLYPYKRPLFFLISSYSIFLYGIFTVYTGYAYHHYFLFIYLIMAFWITLSVFDVKTKFKCFVNIVLISLFLNFILISNFAVSEEQWLYKYILSNKKYSGSTIVMPELEGYLRALLPYSSQRKFKLKDYCSDEPLNYKLVRHNNLKYCSNYSDKNPFVYISSERINSLIDGNTYLFLRNTDISIKNFKINDINFVFEDCIKNSNYCYWKVERID